MKSEESRDVTVSVPDALAEWLTEKSAALGVSREELLVQLLSAYRLTDEEGGAALESAFSDPDAVDADQLSALEASLNSRLTQEVGSVDEKIDSKIKDVRARVIQLKKEADAKAERSHSHREFATLAQTVEQLRTELSAVATDVDDESDKQAENYAAIADRLDDLESKLQTVARVTLDMRRERRDEAATADRERLLTDLRQTAAKHDSRKAKCAGCGAPIDIALLSDPSCPACDQQFTDIEPGTWLLRSPRLVNTRPELESPPEAESELDVLSAVVGEVSTDGGDDR